MKTLRVLMLASLGALTPLTLPVAAFAQEDVDDDLDDILGTGDPEPASVSQERKALEREAELETAQAQVALPEPSKKLIKALPKKTFIKLGRFEAVPQVGIVTNDPFVQRILFGAALGYHITDLFEIEVQGAFSPNFGAADQKEITNQLLESNGVVPEISRQMWHATLNLNFSPFYGKITTRRSAIVFDIYGSFGAGVVGTDDDLEIKNGTGSTPDQAEIDTRVQTHPAMTLGGGLRIAFNKTFALRFEGRALSYINTLASRNLELKNNMTLLLGASIFFGRRIDS